ncbi:MAG TPA: aminotransferase class I/II-fold pyridoxal phosphate-dependent enzyme [Nitriliruptorales bacterium]
MSRSVASAAAVGPPPGMRVRLSSNESPFGPSPAVVEAMQRAVLEAHRYSDDQSAELRSALAEHEGVTPGQVTVGNGSANVLMDLVAQLCGGGADDCSVLAFERAFIVYRLGASAAGARYVEAPVGSAYDRDPEALLDRIDASTRLVLIDNPANPTGDHLTGHQVRRLVEGVPEHVTLVFDEAYHHFAAGQRGYTSVADLGVDHPRLAVLRTFSKAHALAGLRVGYLSGPTELIGPLDARRARFNVNAVAQAAALASLADPAHIDRTVQGTLEGRSRMADGLRELGVPFVDGLGNFLLVELGEPAPPIVEAFAEHGVGVRPLAPYGLTEQIRVSIGTPGEVAAFLTASKDVLAGVAARG